MVKAEINIDVLKWAIDRLNVNIDIIKNNFPKIDKWLEGEERPTFKQLENLSQKLFVPFGAFFTSKPPEGKLPIPFFRTLPSNRLEQCSPELIDTFRIIKQRQDWAKEYLFQIGREPLNFIGAVGLGDNILNTARQIRERLELINNWASHHATWLSAFNQFIEKAESVGMFVFINGVVGNNTHRKLNVGEFRGFVLTDEYAPFIFINGQDAKAAQMFTLAHEISHIWVGRSAAFDLRNMQPAEDKLEQFCNQVAAEILVPQEDLKLIWHKHKISENPYQEVARHFKVSEIVAARRALDIGFIKKNEFLAFYDNYLKKEKKKAKGGDFYAMQFYRAGKRFSQTVYQAVSEGNLLYRDAYKMTGLYGKTFDEFTKKLRSK